MKRIAILLALALLLSGCTRNSAAQPEPTGMPPESHAEPQKPPQRSSASENKGPTVRTILPAFGGSIAECKAQNSDVVGWLQIPGTDIDEVVPQNPENDNNYYLERNPDGEPDANGSFCADCRVDFSADLPRITSIFGHNFSEDPDGVRFAQLKRFKEPDFARANPYVFFSTAERDMAWEIFAVADMNASVPYINPDLNGKTFSTVLENIYSASIYDYGVAVSENDRLLALTCCTYSVPGVGLLPLNVPNDFRFVVMARLVDPDEPIKDAAAISVNDNLLSPLDMPLIYHEWMEMFRYGGADYFRMYDNSAIESFDTSSFELLGEIRRSGIIEDFNDWDAIQLAVDTQIFRADGLENILIAKVDGEFIVYLKQD